MLRSTIVLLALLTFGCVSAEGIGYTTFKENIRHVYIGMTKAELLHLFPNAQPRGAKKYSDEVIEVLEVNVEKYSFAPSGKFSYRNEMTGMEGQPQWFYFLGDKLIQYGRPEDWPEADVVLTIR